MSAYCSVEIALKNLSAFDSKLTFESFLIRAASKAFAKVFKI